MKQLDKNLSSLEGKKRRVEKTNAELMRAYAEQKTMVGSSVRLLLERVTTRSVRNASCISTSIM